MVDIETAREIALSLPGAVEQDHFGKPAFRTKRIFSTLWISDRRMVVMLSPIDQSVFHSFDASVFYPVPNKWGLKGATVIELDKVSRDMLEDALTLAWEKVK
ncbi:MmcQ/YjbR family DNA-binding protein [Mucilaginibacter sp. BJC16-A38]|uniref:MmcQ/YjbR family DNA-binding protein n=1 Tax=Mucilaginibacter phenanthrenivorans TaxID=1234842 RepID=UPI002158944B|nr:MmcQ/YjbR family DNA-binding protein [Mucilaginibacter phenanthrenivorans]MCR8561706.1 MmcQ/YjbR family DNA-binding protein [Mucilaginibacter phenanthrenivorans]